MGVLFVADLLDKPSWAVAVQEQLIAGAEAEEGEPRVGFLWQQGAAELGEPGVHSEGATRHPQGLVERVKTTEHKETKCSAELSMARP